MVVINLRPRRWLDDSGEEECPFMTTPPVGPVYVSRLLSDRAMARLRSLGTPVRVDGEGPPTRAELENGIAGASAAVITLTERVDAGLLAAAGPQLQVIANVAVGYDNIDLAAAGAAGVIVTNTGRARSGDRRPYLRPDSHRCAPCPRG